MKTEEILTAHRTGNPIRDYFTDPAKLEKEVQTVLAGIYELKGADADAKAIEKAAYQITSRARIRFADWTVAELGLALEYGVCGQFGGATFLNGANFLSWLDSYERSTERREAIGSYNLARRQEHRPTISPAEHEARQRDFYDNEPRRAWENFKANGWNVTFSGYGAAVLDALQRHGLARNFSEDTKTEAMKIARQNTTKRDLFQQVAPSQAVLENEYKTVLLRKYFEALKNAGRELAY